MQFHEWHDIAIYELPSDTGTVKQLNLSWLIFTYQWKRRSDLNV